MKESSTDFWNNFYSNKIAQGNECIAAGFSRVQWRLPFVSDECR